MIGQSAMSVETISEDAFKRLCDEIYRDRFEIYEFNPAATRRDALLWMLMGCLISLLSIDFEELESLTASSRDYSEVVCRLVREHAASPPFDPRLLVEELANRAGNE
ncbi:MAG TPA: hypothetical protein VJS44_02475 [Pyrinomonadaceae bacterium]|nr:hypothetical protein [Pyrinomonadaceae bacterium]